MNGKKVSKKDARKLVYNRLTVALTEFKVGIKNKKFEDSLKKASKLFAVDIVKASHRKKVLKNSEQDTTIENEVSTPGE